MYIAIDIGHAENTGASANGLQEHTMCLCIGLFLRAQLINAGHTPIVLDYPCMSNSGDLDATILAANAEMFDCGISLHCDASDNPKARGAHVCFYPGSVAGGWLAKAIAGPLCELLPGRDEQIKTRGMLKVLKKTLAPWALCECGFLTNDKDAALIKNKPERIAAAIVKGINAYAKRLNR